MYVSLAYGLTQPTKLAIKRAAKRRFKKTKAAHPGLTDREVETEMMLEEIRSRESDNLWGDLWVHHPLPDMGEPEKIMSTEAATSSLHKKNPRAPAAGSPQLFPFNTACRVLALPGNRKGSPHTRREPNN
ncbi:MAG TPA: hypothetical protein VGK27_02755 [Candidatus Deferrimicrobiaceae bacterium]|jgi:hypothetical protein